MRVKISWDCGLTFERECDLCDAFCSWDAEGLETARRVLEASGRCWIGGGAAPTGLLVRVWR